MKITLYTITDCPFSKQEKEYLSSHQLTFEEKNLETNREFLTEMLAVSNNFAGTPVTKVEKDDGQIVVLKGFTKEEFDKLLGFSVESVPTPKPVPVEVVKPLVPVVETPPVTVEAVPTPTPPPASPAVVSTEAGQPPVVPTTPVAPDVSAEASAKADPLANVLSNLEQQVNAVPTKPETPIQPTPPGTDSTASTVQPSAMPTIPDPQL